jgi:hypothetical protein
MEHLAPGHTCDLSLVALMLTGQAVLPVRLQRSGILEPAAKQPCPEKRRSS